MPTIAPITKKRQGNSAWVWFAYTSFLFIDPLIEPRLYLWLGTIAAFFVFLGIFALYVRASDEGSPIRFWMIAATFVLGLITFPWIGGASTFFVYAAAFLPFSIVSLRRVFSIFLLEVLLVLAEGYIFHAHAGIFHIGWPNTLIAIFLMGIIGGGNVLFAQERRADRKLRAALEENLALAAVAERERIARDLHDLLGHTLSLITLKAELARKLVDRDPQRAKQEMQDVEHTSRAALADVREAISGYRGQGLAAELLRARQTLETAGIAVDCEASEVPLSPAQETVLALALREAVTNVVRHAQAQTCSVRLGRDEQLCTLEIADNGCGADGPEGNGLRGMRERLEAIGGSLQRQTAAGTRLVIHLPLAPMASALRN